MKYGTKAAARLKLRRQTAPTGKGFKVPGSMNAHKAMSLTTRNRTKRRKQR